MLKDFTKEKFDIFIQAGQSNSEGYGFGEVENPYNPCQQVYYLTNEFMIERAREQLTQNKAQSNFGLPFVREYIERGMLGEGRKILIIRAAAGGTGWADHRWGMTDDLYLRMMDMIETALSLNPENKLIALLWHQGETDAQKGASFETHYNNLKNLLVSVREKFGVSDLPFITADFVHSWKCENVELCTPVIDAIRAVCRDCPPAAFIETDGLLSNLQELGYNPLGWLDIIHFSRKAIYELAHRYFEAFIDLQNT